MRAIMPDNFIRCNICPHRCPLKENARGRCFVRKNENGKIVLSTYGRISTAAIDPIEKKTLYHFLPGTDILSVGFVGCNLACQFCQNAKIACVRNGKHLNTVMSPPDLADLARMPSVAFTYNEPVPSLEYVVDASILCRENGIRTVAVSNGYISRFASQPFFENLDAANIDLKAFNDAFYTDICGASLKPVLDTLVYIREKTKVWLELTTLIIPGANDDPLELREMMRFIVGNLGDHTPLHLSGYHPTFKYRQSPPTAVEDLLKAASIAREEGLKYVYTGNVVMKDFQSTACKNCGAVLIEREGYSVVETGLDEEGSCVKCKTACDGVFR